MQWSFYLSLNDVQKILGYSSSQMVGFLKSFSWALTLYIGISNTGGSAWKKKIVHLVCVVEVKLKEVADIFAAMDFDRVCRFTVLESVKYSDPRIFPGTQYVARQL